MTKYYTILIVLLVSVLQCVAQQDRGIASSFNGRFTINDASPLNEDLTQYTFTGTFEDIYSIFSASDIREGDMIADPGGVLYIINSVNQNNEGENGVIVNVTYVSGALWDLVTAPPYPSLSQPGSIFRPGRKNYPLVYPDPNATENLKFAIVNNAILAIGADIPTFSSGTANQKPAVPKAGDVFYDTSTNTMEMYTVGGWKNISGDGGGTSSGADLPTQAPTAGNMFYETDRKILWISDGDNWKEISSAGTIPGGNALPQQPVAAGNMFYDTVKEILYVSDGANWKEISSGGSTPSGDTPPNQPGNAGNMFYDTDKKILYVSDGANWKEISSAGSTPGGDALPQQPVAAGNMFYDTVKEILYVSDGANWKEISSGGSTPSGDTPPNQPGNAGNMFYETDAKTLWISNGTAQWKEVLTSESALALTKDNFFVGDTDGKAAATKKSDIPINGFGAAQDTVAMGGVGAIGHRITNMANPVREQDAATKKYVDDLKALPVTGKLYKGTVVDLDAFTALSWGNFTPQAEAGSSISGSICNLSSGEYTWIAFPLAWGNQSFFYKYKDGQASPILTYAVFEGFEKRVIQADEEHNTAYQLWIFKMKPPANYTVQLIVNN